MAEILDAEVVRHRRARAAGIHVGRAGKACRVAPVNGPEINAEARAPRGVRDGRVQLGPGEDHHPAHGGDDAQVRVRRDRLQRLRLLAGIDAHVLGRVEAAGGIPALVVVAGRAVGHRPVPVVRVERHGVVRRDVEHGHPPVQLAERRRVPGVPVRMKGVGDAGGEVAVAGGGAEARHVEIGVLRGTAVGDEHRADEALRLGMMDEAGLQFRQQRGELGHRHLVLGDARDRAPRTPRESCLAGELAELQGRRRRRVDEQFARIKTLAARVVIEGAVEPESSHAADVCQKKGPAQGRANTGGTRKSIHHVSVRHLSEPVTS